MQSVMLTDKERQLRGLDALGRGLRPVVDDRMKRAVGGADWVSLYQAKESHRLGRPYRADAGDPRLLLRVLRFERHIFTEIDATQRAWIDELIQASNRAAHASTVAQAAADRALDTMALLAESLELIDLAAELVSLRMHSGEPSASVPDGDEARADAARSPQPAQRIAVDAAPRGSRSLSARVGSLDVECLFRETVNFALVHNRVSPIVTVVVTNRGEEPTDDVTLTFEIDPPATLPDAPVVAPLVVPVGAIDARSEMEIPSHQLSWRLSPAPFVGLDEATLTGIHLTVRLGDGPSAIVVRDSADLRLLTADEWWAVSVPESLAAFVRPNDPAIGALLTEASELLLSRTGSPSLEGYQSGPERVHLIAEAVYDAIAGRRITYVEAPSSFEGTGQRIRTHSEVLEERRGTCLDLACTYAAALEQAGVHPVLTVAQGHAFTGYLTDETELPTVAVTERGAIITIADSDVFDAVELTAVCLRSEPVSFDEARGDVRRWWRTDLSKIEYLLDVHAAHRRVQPLPSIRVEGAYGSSR